VTRRDALKKLGIGAGIAWSAPVVMSFFSSASAAGTPSPTSTSSSIPVNPECTGATCDTFVQCSENLDCVCASTSDGDGLCLPGSVACEDFQACGPGFSCPDGFVCIVDSCCETPVCVDLLLNAQCPPIPDGDVARRRAGRQSTGAGTLGG
jgi:hypothetical protein